MTSWHVTKRDYRVKNIVDCQATDDQAINWYQKETIYIENIVGKAWQSIFSSPIAAPATCTEITGGWHIFFYLGCYLSELFSLHFLGKIMVHFFCRQGRGTTITQSSYQSEKAEEADSKIHIQIVSYLVNWAEFCTSFLFKNKPHK